MISLAFCASSFPREKHEASDIERYNIEVCVSRKEEIPICFWTFHGRRRGNIRIALFFPLDSLRFMMGRLGMTGIRMAMAVTDDGV